MGYLRVLSDQLENLSAGTFQTVHFLLVTKATAKAVVRATKFREVGLSVGEHVPWKDVEYEMDVSFISEYDTDVFGPQWIGLGLVQTEANKPPSIVMQVKGIDLENGGKESVLNLWINDPEEFLIVFMYIMKKQRDANG